MKLYAAVLLCILATNLIQKPDGKPDKHSSASNAQPNPTIGFIDNRTTAPEEKRTEQKPPKWYTTSAAAEWALFFVGVAGIIAAICSLRAINRQISEMSRQREVMFGQMRTMQEQVTEMSAQSGILQESVNVARDAAKAAKVSADIAAGVAIPTLKVEKFELGNMGSANIMAILQLPKLNIVIRNYGQSPAFLHSWSIVLTCEELPDVPAYFGHPGSGNILDKIVVQPNQPYALPGLPGWRRQAFSTEDIEAIISRKKILSVYGYVCYGDIFGNPLKRLKFGEFAVNIGDNGIDWWDMDDPRYCGTDLHPHERPGTKV
jgi:hypothetical protein